jgi:hypothetical protein
MPDRTKTVALENATPTLNVMTVRAGGGGLVVTFQEVLSFYEGQLFRRSPFKKGLRSKFRHEANPTRKGF